MTLVARIAKAIKAALGGPITGTVAGTTSTFAIGFIPAVNFAPLQSPPTVSVDDTANVTLGPVSTDGNFEFTATVLATDPNPSYNITVTGVNSLGATVSATFNVPVLPAPPPPAQPITGFTLSQVS